jgi:chromosomal replication initiator protein
MTEALLHAWEHCKTLLAARLPNDDATAWLPGLQLITLEPRRVVLGGLPSAFFKSRVEKQFRSLVIECLRAAFPGAISVEHPRLECRVGAAAPPALPPASDQLPLPLTPLAPPGETVTLPRPPVVTFSSVIEGDGNRSALRFAREIAAQPGTRYNPLYLAGPTGAGKTHVLQALATELRAAHPGLNVVLVSGEAYKVEVLEAIQARRMRPVREKYHGADALLIDGLQFLLVTPKAQEELLHTFDKLHGGGRQVVVTADRLPQEMTGLNETLCSRLAMGLIAELALPDSETRLRILRDRAARDDMALPDSVAAFLAEQIANPRQLVGALVRLSAYSALLRQPVTLAFAREYAAPFLPPEPKRNNVAVSPETVVGKVCERMGISQRALRAPEKSTAQVRARQIVIYLLKDLAGLSYSEISRWVGNRAPSTLSHAYRCAQKQLEESAHLRRMVTQLQTELIHSLSSSPIHHRSGGSAQDSNALSNKIQQ